MELSDKIQICKVVARAVLADAMLTDTELAFLNRLMDKYELDEDQRKDVMARNIDDDVSEMAEQITEFDSKNELMTELAQAVAVDGEISSSEKQLLSDVAAALGIDQAELDMLVETALT
jgi:tellurite resistance protein